MVYLNGLVTLKKSNPVWTENGLFLEIWGRDVTVLLWKKME